MVKLSQQLDARPTRTERVEEQQRIEEIKRLQDAERQRLQAKVDIASAKFKDISYEDYEKEYNKLDAETKQFFTSPEKLKQTEGYQTYVKEKAEYDKQLAEYEAQQQSIAYANQQKAEWEQAYSIIARGSRYDPRSSVGRKIQKIHEHREMAEEDYRQAQIKSNLQEQGFKPIWSGGKIIGYEDPTRQMSFPLDAYTPPTISQKDITPDYSKDPLAFLKPQYVSDAQRDFFETYVYPKQSIAIPQKSVADAESKKWYDKSTEELFIDPAKTKFKRGVSTIWETTKNVYDVIPSGKFYYTPSTFGMATGLPLGTLSPYKRSDTSIDVTEGIGMAQEDLGEVRADVLSWAVGKEKIEKLDLEIEEKYQEKYQTEFDQKYLDELMYGSKTFEQASKEFETSAEAKRLQKEYAEEYSAEYKALSQDAPLMRKILGGIAFTGLSFGQLGLGAVKTPKSAVLTAGLVYTGYGALKLIPASVGVTTSIGFTAYGGYKTFSPTSTVEEAGGGVLMLATGGLSLGYSGYKYLRSPVIKTVPIKSPKMDLKASEVITKDLKIITDQGTAKRVIFETQKLSQTGTAGRRTVVSTKIRKYLNLDPIYEGVPVPKAKYSVEGLGGSFSYSTPSNYQKAFKKLTKYGYTDAQAKATLRYTAPKVTEQYLEKGIIAVKGEKALAEFEFLTERPVIDVDELLGIKTRGAKTIKDIYDVERKLIDIKGKSFVFEERTRTSFLLKKGRVVDFKDFDFARGVSVGKATDLKKGYEYLGKDQLGLDIFKEAEIQDIYGVSFSRKLLPSENIINIDTSRTKLISKVIDLQTKRYGVTPAKIKKTPLSKTFGSEVEDVKKIIRSKPTSQVGEIPQQQVQGFDIQQLKSAIRPDVKSTTKIKDLIKTKQLDKMAGLKYKPAISTKALLDLKTDLKEDVKLKQDLKSIISLKDILKEDTLLKTQQIPALKTSPALRQILRSKLDLKTPTGISLKTPVPRIPKPPQINIPTFTIPLWLKSAIRGKQKKGKKGEFEEFAVLPDFTARAIGLDPDVISGKQAQARIKKILTGLEVRKGVVIK